MNRGHRKANGTRLKRYSQSRLSHDGNVEKTNVRMTDVLRYGIARAIRVGCEHRAPSGEKERDEDSAVLSQEIHVEMRSFGTLQR